MGTRGAYGFHKNGVDKITYNHMNSYPWYLGANVANFVRNHSIDELNNIFENIELVNDGVPPTPEQIAELGGNSKSDWYWLLRNSQGDLEAYANGLKYMVDNASFMQDSLFCEWAYVINLDTNTLEVYGGFQESPNSNRYSIETPSDSGYYSVSLVGAFDLSDIPDDWVEQVHPSTAEDE